MKLTRRQLMYIIRESRQSLLLELFKNLNPYPFSARPYTVRAYNTTGEPSEIPLGSEYNFTTEAGLNYSVFFTHMDFEGVNDDEDVSTAFSLDKNVYWDIQFKTSEQGHDLTNQNDMKVLHTIIATVKDFVQNVLPNFEDSAFRETRTFISECNSEYPGDDRRAKVYQYMLKKQGIVNSEIAEINRTVYNDRGMSYKKLDYFIKFEV